MNKTDLVNAVAKAGFSKKDADTAINAVFDSITDALKNGDKVQLVGFGTFSVVSAQPGKVLTPHKKRRFTFRHRRSGL